MQYITSQAVRNTSPALSTSTNTCTCTACQVCDTCNAINDVRKLVTQNGYYGYIQPNGVFQYFNVFDVQQKLLRPERMLELFESLLGFQIISEDPQAHPQTKMRLGVMASLGNELKTVYSYTVTADGCEAILFKNGDLVYSALTGLDHQNNHRKTITIDDGNAFAKVAKLLAKKKNPLVVFNALEDLVAQGYIAFPDLFPQFRAYIDQVGGKKYLNKLTRNTGQNFFCTEEEFNEALSETV